MRIAVVNWSSRRVGGIEEYLSIVIPALRRAGQDVAFWHEMDAPADRERIEVPHDVADICAADIGNESAIAALRAWKPDVIYAQGIRDLEIEKRILDLAPSVYFLHTYTGTCISGAKTFTRPSVAPCDRAFGWPCLIHYFPHGCGGRSPATMWRQFTRQSAQLEALRNYGAVLTHSAHMQKEMVKHGLAAEVVSYPVHELESVPIEKLGSWRLLFAARMERLKGGAYLLDALPAVSAAVKQPLRVVLAGDGVERQRLEAHARRIAASVPRVQIQFTGWVTNDRIATLLADTDLLVVPSLWPEPFGSIGPVAARHGVPSAAFDVGGISEWLVDGIGGHLAAGNPPTPEALAGAIVRCLADPLHYAELRGGALQTAARFTMERHLAELLPVLQRVMDEHRSSQ